MPLIIPNQKCSYKGKNYEPGQLYSVSNACAKKLIGDRKAKLIKEARSAIQARIPQIINRDPEIESV